MSIQIKMSMQITVNLLMWSDLCFQLRLQTDAEICSM